MSSVGFFSNLTAASKAALLAVSASSWTLPIVVSVGLHVGAVRLMQGGFDFGPNPKPPPPIEVEILFEETPVPDSVSAVLEQLDLVDEQTLEELAAAEDLPILEPITADEPGNTPEVDPLFLPDASEFEDLPEGLDEFVSTAPVNSNLNADLSQDMTSTNVSQPANDQSPTPEQIEEALTQDDANEAPASDGAEEASAEPDETEAEVATAEPEPVINYPLIPKPRPRAPPRVTPEPDNEAEATEQVADAGNPGEGNNDSGTDEGQSAANGSGTASIPSAADRSAAELAATRHAQDCFDMNMTLNHFIRYTNSWQVAFVVNFDAEGNVISAEKGKIAYPNGATREMIDAFTDNVRETIYECRAFKNPEGIDGVPFEVELIYQPGA